MLKVLENIFIEFEAFIIRHHWFAPLSTVILPFIEALFPSLPLVVIIGFNLTMMAMVFSTIEATIFTIILSTIGSFLGMLIIFLLIRYSFGMYFTKKVEKSKYGKAFVNIVEGPNTFLVFMVMANPFFPSSIINYILSLTKTTTKKYLLLTFSSRLIIISLLIFLGSIFDIQRNPLNLLWFSLFYLLLFSLWYLYYHHFKTKKPALKNENNEDS